MCTSKLISYSTCGNLHDACNVHNQLGMSDYVVTMQCTGNHTVTVFKVPNEKVPAVWRKFGLDPLTCPITMKD